MTHPDSPEFLAILERVPRWHTLMPGVDLWRSGDEWARVDLKMAAPIVWYEYKAAPEAVNCVARRPIPETVRRSMAWWALYNKLATVAPDGEGFAMYVNRYGLALDSESSINCHGIRKFPIAENDAEVFRERIAMLGGEAEIIKNLQEGPGAYMRWILDGAT